jgi:hypothetical protein
MVSTFRLSRLLNAKQRLRIVSTDASCRDPGKPADQGAPEEAHSRQTTKQRGPAEHNSEHQEGRTSKYFSGTNGPNLRSGLAPSAKLG